VAPKAPPGKAKGTNIKTSWILGLVFVPFASPADGRMAAIASTRRPCLRVETVFVGSIS
jgi:hypothetical protein